MAPGRTDLPMAVAELAREDVATVPLDASIPTVARTMADRRVGSVVVVDDDAPVGIVTDRDLVVELLAGEGERNPLDPAFDGDGLTVADVMTTEPLTASVDDRLPRALHHMNEARARRVPLVDADGRLAGILALDDVIVHLAGESTHVSAQLDNVSGVIHAESPEP